MEVLYVIIPLAIAFAGLAVTGFVWSVRSQQYSDPKGTAHRILLDDNDRS